MAIYGAQPMLPLPEEMARRQSQQAGMLQSAQAQMGGLGQAPPGGGMPGGGGPPSAPPGAQGQSFSGVMQQRQQQAQTLQARQADIQIGERMMQLLDPRIPRPARQFLFRELSRQIGVDPKGEQAKEIGAMVTALDPQTLESLRRSVATRVQSARPGEITEFARGVLTGQVPITELMTPASGASPGDGTVNITSAGAQGGASPPSAAPTPATGGGPGALTSGSAPFPGRMSLGAGGLTGGLDQAGAEGAPVVPVQAPGTPRVPGSPGDTVGAPPGPPLRMPPEAAPPGAAPRPPEASVPPLQREIAPELAEILGLDSTQRYRNIDVIRGAGFRRIPTEFDQQRRIAGEIRSLQDGVVSTVLSANQLYALIEGRADALNLSLGRLPLIGEVTVPNPSSAMVQIRDYLQGVGTAMGFTNTTIGTDPESSRRILETARELAQRYGGVNIDPNAPQDAATRNSQIQALLINLAFSMAAAQGQTGRNLSDRDLELQLQALGRSANPEQFQAAIETTVGRIYAQYLNRTTSQVGAPIPLGHAVPNEISQALSEGPVTPRHLVEELTGQPFIPQSRRMIQHLPPDPAAPEGATSGGQLGTADPGLPGRFTDQHTFVPFTENIPGTREEVVPGAQAGPAVVAPDRRRLDRASPTLEQEEAVGRRRAEEDRAGVLAARAADARRLEISESQERRAARTETRTVEEQRRQRIRDAFAQVAAALRTGSGSAGISVSSAGAGGDQDPNAFKLQPAPQRRAPEPVDASRFRRN